MNNFLPDNYEVPKSEGKYMKFEQGDNKFRILDKPIFGWEAWTLPDTESQYGKPVRFPMDNPPVDLRGYKDQKKNHFWAMPVWNFHTKSVQVLEITQKTIQKALEALARNEDWGSPLGYNITVKREGEKFETEYFINPSPHSDVPEDAAEAWEEAKKNGFDISRLFDGGDPFAPEDKEF